MTDQPEFNFKFAEPNSEFRQWITEKWFEYKDEVEQWEKREVVGTPQEYFNKWKWFLKAKYKQETQL